jgi:hypothetical protein
MIGKIVSLSGSSVGQLMPTFHKPSSSLADNGEDAMQTGHELFIHVRAQHGLGAAGSMFVSGSLFAEQRNNGTTLQVNSTHLGELQT